MPAMTAYSAAQAPGVVPPLRNPLTHGLRSRTGPSTTSSFPHALTRSRCTDCCARPPGHSGGLACAMREVESATESRADKELVMRGPTGIIGLLVTLLVIFFVLRLLGIV